MSDQGVSCVIPVFNGGRVLAEAIDSVLAQTRAPEQILVVDDGSTDATAEVAAAYGTRLSYVFQENLGPAAARNAGMKMVTGEFVAFLDADDWWHPEKLEKQLAGRDVNKMQQEKMDCLLKRKEGKKKKMY